MIERAWTDEERYSSAYTKSWCRPFDVNENKELLLAAMKYTLSLGVDVLVPPGNFEHFKFAAAHIDEALANPLSEDDRALLAARLPAVKEYPFYPEDCYSL